LKNTFNIINLTLKINYKRMQMDREREGGGNLVEIDKGKDSNWTNPLMLFLFFIFCQNFNPKKPINCSSNFSTTSND
jgi:hypothetical protein